MTDTGYRDYKQTDDIYSTCEVEGKIPDGAPVCERNREGLKRTRGNLCMYFRSNGSCHCDHKRPPK